MERTDHPEKYSRKGRSKINEGNSGWATRWHDPPRWEPHRIIYVPTQRNEAQFCMLNLRATVADGQPHAHLQGHIPGCSSGSCMGKAQKNRGGRYIYRDAFLG